MQFQQITIQALLVFFLFYGALLVFVPSEIGRFGAKVHKGYVDEMLK